MNQFSCARSLLAPFSKTALPVALLIAAAVAVLAGSPAHAEDAPAEKEFCFTPPGAAQECHRTLGEAEAKLRASTPLGPYLHQVGESKNSDSSWFYLYYSAVDKREPESERAPGYRVGGWTPANLGCAPSPAGDAGPEYCASEQEAVSIWIANRAAFLGAHNCEYRNHSLVGSHAVPSSLSGAYSGARAGSAHFTDRFINEAWWCPGWGTPDPVETLTQVVKNLPFSCPEGFVIRNPAEDWPKVCAPAGAQFQIIARNRQPRSDAANCNPCYPATGEKQRHERDFEFAGESFIRSYRSVGQLSQGNMGQHWNHSLGARVGDYNSYSAYLLDNDGSFLPFEWSGSDGSATLYRIRGTTDLAARVSGPSIEVVDPAGHTRIFSSSNGRLLRRIHASDPLRDIDFSYDADGLLIQVLDGSQRALTFNYSDLQVIVTGAGANAVNRTAKLLTGIVLPDGGLVAYDYDAYGNLVEVTRPDGSSRQYHYGEAEHLGAPAATMMTGISDNNVRYATFTYDQYQRVTSSTLAGNAERTSLAYVSANVVDVTTPNGLVRRHTYAPGLHRRLVSITDSHGTVSNVHDTKARKTESVDRSGRITRHTYANGMVVATTEAVGLPEERITSFTRDSMGRVTSMQVSGKQGSAQVPVRKWVTTRDSNARVTASCTIDPNGPNASYACGANADAPEGIVQTRLAYCDAAEAATVGGTCPIVGQLKEVDGPLAGTGDRTTYQYYAQDDLSGCATAFVGNCHRRGDLWKVTNGAGHSTTVQRYDLAGRATQIRDANLVTSRLAYDAVGRVSTHTIMGAGGTSGGDVITAMAYDATGKVTRITQPDGSFLVFGYDAARRMNRVEDSVGNVIGYSLDGAGNRFAETTRDAQGVLRKSLTRLFDDLGRVVTIADASANATDLTYDIAGNLESVTDPLGRVGNSGYDALGRLRQSIQNVGGTGEQRAQTSMSYDAVDNLTAVIDPKGLTTHYEYNGLGNLVRLVSPDTGTATYGYDAAGNRTRQVDARGVETQYQYDALGRLTNIGFPTPGAAIGIAYDTVPSECPAGETFAIGRVSQLTDASGATRYCHDPRGNVARKIQMVAGGPTRTLAYGYSAADQVKAITYPSGLLVTYARNAAGQVTGVSARTSSSAAPVTLVASADYQPFGPIKRLAFGNGRVLDKNRDLDYGITSVADSAATGLAIGYTLDDVGNVVALAERQNGGATAARTVAYDGLDRLTALKNGTATVQSFTYDATGNRTKKVSGGSATYLYAADSHRLTKVGTVNRSYDAAGNSTAIGTRTYAYDDRGRMASVSTGTTLTRSYRYNALGQRVAKVHPTTATSTVFYVYDEAGKLMGEYNPSGTLIREYIWLDDTLVAVRGTHAGQAFQYVLTDHLDTPRAVVLPSTNAIVWRWDLTGSAFGEHAALNNPDGDTANYTFNLRYPGQYFDSETGLHYNYFRDYEPGTGRYVQSDPAGIFGGLATFSYANSRPHIYVDPDGRNPVLLAAGCAVAGGTVGAVSNGVIAALSEQNWQQAATTGAIGGAAGGIATCFVGPVIGGAVGAMAEKYAAEELGYRERKCNWEKDYAVSAAIGGFMGFFLSGPVAGTVEKPVKAAANSLLGNAGSAFADIEDLFESNDCVCEKP